MKIPLCIPFVEEEEIKAVEEVLKSGWLAHGPVNEEFEKEFSKYLGVKHSISLNSCTSALQLALQSKNLRGEVILPSFTFSASANSVVNANCKPVFCDIEYDSCNIDPNKIEEKISDKTVAIMPVHFAGQTCKMDMIMEIVEKHDVEVVEDSAETLGGEFKGKKSGTFGTGCFSFYPTKNITTGEGGMVTTNDNLIAEKIKMLKAHGMSKSTFERERVERPWFRASEISGYNMRLCDILAAIGLVQLRKLDKMNEMRRKNAQFLNKNLDFDELSLPLEQKDCYHVYQMYTIKLNKKINRQKFITRLRGKGVMASVHFDPPVHLQPFYKAYSKKIQLPITELVSESIVTLPFFPHISQDQLEHIVTSIEEVIKIFRTSKTTS